MKRISTTSINQLAIPSIIAGLVEPIISFTDLTLVGQSLSHEAIAGVGLGAYLIMLFIWIFSSLRNSTSALIALSIGQKKLNEAKNTLYCALLISIVIGFVITLFSNIAAEQIFLFQNARGKTLSFSLNYYQIRSLAIPFTLATLTLFGGFKGFQNTTWAMIIIIIGGITNLLLDIVLVNGLYDVIPKLGVEGAAIASLISQIIMFFLALSTMVKHFSFQWPHFATEQTKELLTMSLDLIIRSLAMNSVFLVSNKLATSYGSQHMAAHSLLFWLWLFQCYFIDGYSNAAMAISGKLKGMKDNNSIYELGIKVCKINIIIALALAALMWISYPLILSISNSYEMNNVFKEAFFIMLISFPIGAIAFSFDGVFIGLGKASFLRNLLILSSFLIFMPFMYYFHTTGYQTTGIWASMLIWLFVRGAIPFFSFIRTFAYLKK